MNCPDARIYLMAYLDDELDVADTLRVEQHLSTCQECGAVREEALALRSLLRDPELYAKPPEALRDRVKFAVRQAAQQESRSAWYPVYRYSAIAAALIAVMSGAWLLTRPSNQNLLASEIVDSHVRSLQPGHLIDVPSSDRHTVKPWFQGKLDFSPPVPDLSQLGWILTGGRLDYMDKRPVAVLVYRRGKHDINVYVWPSAKSGNSNVEQTESRGYQILHWNQASMNYWVVSDLNGTELRQFADELRRE
jgi:anti-sigma factor RsiW